MTFWPMLASMRDSETTTVVLPSLGSDEQIMTNLGGLSPLDSCKTVYNLRIASPNADAGFSKM